MPLFFVESPIHLVDKNSLQVEGHIINHNNKLYIADAYMWTDKGLNTITRVYKKSKMNQLI